jgi:CheY-like chemotaxis protein
MLNALNLIRGRSAKPGSTPLSILAIDDETAVLRLIEHCFRGTAWKVTGLSDLKQGLELDRNALPDVILCDASMPAVSGPQLIAMLKSNPLTENVPVVLMSGFADADMFLHVPWSGFLAKPFGPKELIEAIESAVRSRGQTPQPSSLAEASV